MIEAAGRQPLIARSTRVSTSGGIIAAEVVGACRNLPARALRAQFRHQRGHESTFAGRNDFATCTACADQLASDNGLRPA